MFSRYRSSSTAQINEIVDNPLENIQKERQEQQEQQEHTQEQGELKERVKKALEYFGETNRASFIEPYPFRHCLKKRRAFIIYAISNELYNECLIETHNILNQPSSDFETFRGNINSIIQRITEYAYKRFNYTLNISSELEKLISQELESLVLTGTDTLKIRANYSRIFSTLVSKVAALVHI